MDQEIRDGQAYIFQFAGLDQEEAFKLEQFMYDYLLSCSRASFAHYFYYGFLIKNYLEQLQGEFLETSGAQNLNYDTIINQAMNPITITDQQKIKKVLLVALGDKAIVCAIEQAAAQDPTTYSFRCMSIARHVNPQSTVFQEHPESCQKLRDDILAGNLSPEELVLMKESDLCREANQKERDEIALRSQQRVVHKTSRLYKCTRCGKRECTYREVQTRSLDEPATLFCTCHICGHTFSPR